VPDLNKDAAAHSGAYHVVVVDDSKKERQQLARIVEAAGFRTSQTESGRGALDILKRERVDLIATELFMGDIDGWELLEQTKKKYPQTHVVVTTGSVSNHGERLLRSRRADGYLVKPIEAEDARVLLNALLLPDNLDRVAEVVVVEPDTTTLARIEQALAARGLEVYACDNVREASARARYEMPDLLITELALGDESGLDLCCELRSEAATARLPILVLTADASPENVKKAIGLRVNGFMVEPFSERELADRAIKILRQGGSKIKKVKRV
jgi:DNA-binding response OmpR family regulator